MTTSRSYFVFLDEFKASGCPICALVLKDSQSYLDHLFYESVLDVPTRRNLQDSFGFCNWHAWQIPNLPSICSPAVGFSIFASDLLGKFSRLGTALAEKLPKRRIWTLLFCKASRQLVAQIKKRVCPACAHVGEFETFHLKDLLEFITEKNFQEAYRNSPGICIPHFLVIAKEHSAHRAFSILLNLQLEKTRSLRDRLEEFIRKQDHRFQQQITPDEAKSWRIAMECLAGKPGVFSNERRHDLFRISPSDKIADTETLRGSSCSAKTPVGDVVEQIRAAKQVTVYQKQPLPHLLKPLRNLVAAGSHSTVEIVLEDLSDVVYLRQLHSSGFKLFYGVGLPSRSVIFIDSRQGFLQEDNSSVPGFRRIPSKDAEDLYYKLRWCRFGHAVLLAGVVKEADANNGLFRLATNGGREDWCRLKEPQLTELPKEAKMVEVFGWEKWLSHILEILEVNDLAIQSDDR